MAWHAARRSRICYKLPGVLPVPTSKSKPPSTTAKERMSFLWSELQIDCVGPLPWSQILPHRGLQIHKMDRVPPSSQ